MTAACAISPKVVKTSSLTLSSPAEVCGTRTKTFKLSYDAENAEAQSFIEAIYQRLRKFCVDLI